MKTNSQKILTLSAIVAMSLASFVSANTHGDYDTDHEMKWEYHENVMMAVEANDYLLLSEEAQEKISPEEFGEKVAYHEDMEAHRSRIEWAISVGDYEAFKAEMEAYHEMKEENREEQKEEREEKFEEKHEQMKLDREAFCESDDMEMETMRWTKEYSEEEKEAYCSDERETEHAEEMEEKMKEKEEKMNEREEMTDEEKEEKIMERYEELKAYYDEHGMLPEKDEMMKDKKGEKRGEKKEDMKKMKDDYHEMNDDHKEEREEMKAEREEMKEAYENATDEEKEEMKEEMKEMKKEHMEERKEMRKERKHFKDEHRTMVKWVIKNVKKDKIEVALAKIDVMLATVSDEKVIDILEWIKEVFVETLEE